jgi:hypothetical protein
MKSIRLTLSVLAILFACTASAQNNSSSYKTAVGVKFYPGAITVKHFVKETAAIEGIGYFWDKGFRFVGLYELHYDLLQVEGLKWYVGPGAHIGFYNNKYYEGNTLFGIDGIIGIDYKIKGAPLNLSIDWNPSFEFGDGSGFESFGGLAIRFAF